LTLVHLCPGTILDVTGQGPHQSSPYSGRGR
jgi:hypothetical protein